MSNSSGSPTLILRNEKGNYPRRRGKHGSLGRLVGNGSTIITLLTAVLFLSGWIYLSEYYDSFGIDISSLDLLIYASLVASIMAISPILGKFVLPVKIGFIVAIVALLMWLLWQLFWFRSFLGKLRSVAHDATGRSARKSPRGPSRDDNQTPAWVSAVLTFVESSIKFLALLAFALTICFRSDKVAEEQAKLTYKQPRIKTVLTFKTDERQLLSRELLQINGDGGLRLLTQTKDFVVVFVKRELQPGRRGAYMFPTANLVAIHNELLNVKGQLGGKPASK